MARVSKAQMTEKDPGEWVAGAAAARRARTSVAAQVSELISSADLTGSPDYVARRLREYATAVRAGDAESERAALMELSVAAAATAASIDLRLRAAA
jgi:hypothetical protein